jgi:hypothetical protein
LEDLIGNLPGADQITEAMRTDLLIGALVPDTEGMWPGMPGYSPTYDMYFAAARACRFLAGLPLVTTASSEGTAATLQPPAWQALIRYYEGMSTICAASATLLSVVPIPDPPHVVPTDMSGRGSSGDIDTDMA